MDRYVVSYIVIIMFVILLYNIVLTYIYFSDTHGGYCPFVARNHFRLRGPLESLSLSLWISVYNNNNIIYHVYTYYKPLHAPRVSPITVERMYTRRWQSFIPAEPRARDIHVPIYAHTQLLFIFVQCLSNYNIVPIRRHIEVGK